MNPSTKSTDPSANPPSSADFSAAEVLRQVIDVAPNSAAPDAPLPECPPVELERLRGVFPQFEILEYIGAGGMGRVFKIRQPNLDRLAALKILPPAKVLAPDWAERFNREARALARLNHPNIVQVFDFGSVPDPDGLGPVHFIVMEFVDGVNLRQAMRTGTLSSREALTVVPALCDALQYAHTQGILHRDIKPENILIDTAGRVKITDFGVAKLAGDELNVTLTQTGAHLGTPAYMAPEQIESPHDVDHRADIYSLGVVFYEMLTGALPLGRFPSPSESNGTDPRLDTVVFRTLEKERSRRYQSADDMKSGIENAGTAPLAGFWNARTSAPWLKALGIAFVAMGVFAVIYSRVDSPKSTPAPVVPSLGERNRALKAEATDLLRVLPAIEQRHRHLIAGREKAGFARLIPESELAPLLPGGGCFWSFSRLSHDYQQNAQIKLEHGMFSSGFHGGQSGFVQMLNVPSLAEVTLEKIPARFRIPRFPTVADAIPFLAENPRLGVPGFIENPISTMDPHEAPRALTGKVYVVRNCGTSESDIIAAFQVVDTADDKRHGITIAWAILADLPIPTREQERDWTTNTRKNHAKLTEEAAELLEKQPK